MLCRNEMFLCPTKLKHTVTTNISAAAKYDAICGFAMCRRRIGTRIAIPARPISVLVP